MKIFIQILMLTMLSCLACNKKVKKEYLRETLVRPVNYEANLRVCRDQENYTPDTAHLDHTPVKYVRVNFHIMCNSEKKGNFDEKKGREFVKLVYKTANEKLTNNKKMNLPPGNATPVLPIRYQYLLTGRPDDPNDDGIYFHNDDQLYALVGSGKHRNIFNKDVYEKYGIQKDTVLNIFVMTHHLDSLKSKTYVKDSKGIGYPNFVKVTHWYESDKGIQWRNGEPVSGRAKWTAVKLLNHEIGHSLGLRHTWRGNDGCADTPTHSNCWNQTKGKKPCDEWWSNNFMDYNSHSSAWSPCQIATIHRNFADKNKSTRKLLESNWCKLDEEKTIRIQKDFEWLGAKDLEGHLVIENRATLRLGCRLSLPKDAKIIIHPKGKLILRGATLENACGDSWKGIEIWSNKESKGIVEFYDNTQILNAENEVKFIDK